MKKLFLTFSFLLSLAVFAYPQFELFNKSKIPLWIDLKYGNEIVADNLYPEYEYSFKLSPEGKYRLPALDPNTVNIKLSISYENKNQRKKYSEEYRIYNIKSSQTVYLAYDSAQPRSLYAQTGSPWKITKVTESGWPLKNNIKTEQIKFLGSEIKALTE